MTLWVNSQPKGMQRVRSPARVTTRGEQVVAYTNSCRNMMTLTGHDLRTSHTVNFFVDYIYVRGRTV